MELIETHIEKVVIGILLVACSFWIGVQYQIERGALPGGVVIPQNVHTALQNQNVPKTTAITGVVISTGSSSFLVRVGAMTKPVNYTASTTATMVKTTSLSPAKISAGDSVVVFGMAGLDGTFTANQIQVSALSQPAAGQHSNAAH